MPEFSIVIPMRDESGSVRSLLAEIDQAFGAARDYEIICVDDGSVDDTWALLSQAARQYDRLRGVRLATAGGQSHAILTGVTNARSELVATIDGDGQNDPADLPLLVDRMLALAADGPVAMVSGVRQKRQDNRIKKMSSRIANGIRKRALKDDAVDSGCGVRVFQRAAYLRLPYFDNMHRFMPALMAREGYGVEFFPVRHRRREAGASKYGTLDRLAAGIVDLLGVVWLIRRRKPGSVVESFGD